MQKSTVFEKMILRTFLTDLKSGLRLADLKKHKILPFLLMVDFYVL